MTGWGNPDSRKENAMKRDIALMFISTLLLVIFAGASSASASGSQFCFTGEIEIAWKVTTERVGLCFDDFGNISTLQRPLGQDQKGPNEGFAVCGGLTTGYENLSYAIGSWTYGVMPHAVPFNDCLTDPLIPPGLGLIYHIGNVCANYPISYSSPTNAPLVTSEKPLHFITFDYAYNNTVSVISHWRWEGGDTIERTTTFYNDSSSTMKIGSVTLFSQDTPNANGGGSALDNWHGRSELKLFSWSDPYNVNTSNGDSAGFMYEDAVFPQVSYTSIIPVSSFPTPTCPPSSSSEIGPFQGSVVKEFGYEEFGTFAPHTGGTIKVSVGYRF